jgi:dihydroorotase
LLHVLKALTLSPARILGLPAGQMAKGAIADLVLFDPDVPFVVDPATMHSRARNTPFEGRRLQGRAMMTFVGGRCVFDRSKDGKS